MLGRAMYILRVRLVKFPKDSGLSPVDSIVRSFIPSGNFASICSNQSHCILVSVLSRMVRLSNLGKSCSHENSLVPSSPPTAKCLRPF